MKKLLVALSVTGLLIANVTPTFAKSENAAEGKAVGQQERDEGDNGASGNAPGQTGDTGKANAPGQEKKGGE